MRRSRVKRVADRADELAYFALRIIAVGFIAITLATSFLGCVEVAPPPSPDTEPDVAILSDEATATRELVADFSDSWARAAKAVADKADSYKTYDEAFSDLRTMTRNGKAASIDSFAEKVASNKSASRYDPGAMRQSMGEVEKGFRDAAKAVRDRNR